MVCYECEEERKRWKNFNKIGLCVSLFATFVAVWLLVRFEMAPKHERMMALRMNEADSIEASEKTPFPVPATFKERLGNASWTFLQLLASHYPSKPSHSEAQALERFLFYFVRVYTCKVCADEFAKIYRSNPPSVTDSLL